MAEHMDRYQELVEALNTQGYDVVRHNHRGHGKEIDENERGHFNSMNQIVDDAYEIIETLYLEELNVPYIIIGHSMGSIIARSFVEKYPDIAQGLILTGTGMFPKWKGVPIRLAMKLVTFIFGKRRRLKWVNQLLNKTFNKKSLNLEQIVIDFYTSDEVDKFVEDEFCGFKVSNQLIYQTLKTMMKTVERQQLKRMDKELPILFISGKDDPLVNMVKGIKHLARLYKRAGIKHITVQLYKT